ncbi:hypothetical protein J2W91_003515 [Paenibacillus amylolyticus]|uniref:Uncharacterized protein n=2 Tax=Paenibacillus amylolyticus TaxID=1451 RepID=A0AAP5LS09_PAEAM|nr:hypothetical protein [Paenibacillus amylolyticus]
MLTVFTGVVVPIGSVFIGWSLANWRADRKECKDELIQRIKLLYMLRHELETVIAYYDEHKKYYSRETMTGKLLINSALFNVDDHRELLSKLWNYLRVYQPLNEALDSFPTMFAPTQAKLLNKTGSEVVELKNSITDHKTMDIYEAAQSLFEEVLNQIRLIENN